MKYKKIYLEEVEKNRQLNNKNYHLDREIRKAEKNMEQAEHYLKGYREVTEKWENKESDIRTENDWLKATLRLIVVEKGKMVELLEAMKEDSPDATRYNGVRGI